MLGKPKTTPRYGDTLGGNLEVTTMTSSLYSEQAQQRKGLSWRDGSVSKVCLPRKHQSLSLYSQNPYNACDCGTHL